MISVDKSGIIHNPLFPVHNNKNNLFKYYILVVRMAVHNLNILLNNELPSLAEPLHHS